MKVKAIKTGFYNGSIVEVGEVFEIKEKKIPLWCTLATGEQVAAKTKKPEEQKQPEKKQENPAEKKPEVKDPEEKDPDINNAQKLAELDMLLTEGVELDIVIDTENKSVQEQIDELKEKIEKVKQSK